MNRRGKDPIRVVQEVREKETRMENSSTRWDLMGKGYRVSSVRVNTISQRTV